MDIFLDVLCRVCFSTVVTRNNNEQANEHSIVWVGRLVKWKTSTRNPYDEYSDFGDDFTCM